MEYKKGLMLVFLAALISGVSIFVNSYGVKETDSSLFAFMKNAIVALMIFAFLMFTRVSQEIKKISKKQWSQLIVIGLIGGSIPFLLFFKGLQMTTGSVASFIHKTLFVYATVFALIFLREKLNKKIFVAALALLAGNYLLIRPSMDLALGHLLVFGAAMLWAAESVYSKYVMKNLNPNIVAFGRMFFGSLFILTFLTVTDKINLITQLNLSHFAWIGITSLFLFAYVMTFYNGLKNLDVSIATAILTIGTPITMLLTYAFKDSSLTVMQVTGALLILSSAVLIAWLGRQNILAIKSELV